MVPFVVKESPVTPADTGLNDAVIERCRSRGGGAALAEV
jgi:hypothetical protein